MLRRHNQFVTRTEIVGIVAVFMTSTMLDAATTDRDSWFQDSFEILS
jgi:hypothetical protein